MKSSVMKSWNMKLGFTDRNVNSTSRSRINLKVISGIFNTFEFLDVKKCTSWVID